MPAALISLIGGDSLLGREIRDVLAENPLPAQLKLIGTDDEIAGILTEQGGEPALISRLDADAMTGSRAILLAGSPASSRRALRLSANRDGLTLIDMTHALEDHPAARLRAPSAEPAGHRADSALQVIAHPAAVALAMFAAPLPIRRWEVLVMEPASERGKEGLTELQQQTVNLLSFKSLPKDVFDAQVGFNVLVRYGLEAREPLEDVELRIDRHLASLLALRGSAPMPSLRLVQAPVFHGYSMSIRAELEGGVSPADACGRLQAAGVDVRTGEHEHPSNVGAAGLSGLTVGAVETDRNDPRACWFWAVADNLRVRADNGIDVARSLLVEAGA